MKILLIGASGQLGTDLVGALSRHQLVTPPRHTLDVLQPDRIRQVLQSERPRVVINTAAFHQVDACESEVLTAFQANGEAVRNLGLAARDIDAALVHYSTDYVFDGSAARPYLENDRARPLNVYGASKLAGEHLLESVWQKHFLIRTSGLYGRAGSRGKGGNFVETMIRKAENGESIRVVHDQRLTPTSTRELARKTVALIETSYYGLYHVTSGGIAPGTNSPGKSSGCSISGPTWRPPPPIASPRRRGGRPIRCWPTTAWTGWGWMTSSTGRTPCGTT